MLGDPRCIPATPPPYLSLSSVVFVVLFLAILFFSPDGQQRWVTIPSRGWFTSDLVEHCPSLS